MSTVKIKTEPTAATATAVDVKVKFEPSISTADIKLEQHTSDIDTKVESNSEADIKPNDDNRDTNQNQRQFICGYNGCCRSFNSPGYLKRHQREHGHQAEIYVYGKTYTLTRQSLDDRWACPIPECETTSTTADGVCKHIRQCHNNIIGQQLQQQKPPSQITRSKRYFIDVDSFYVDGVYCGYHGTIGVFICHECKLVPECLLTHLQQKHRYDEKSIDNSALPESVRKMGSDPNINQHTSNTHLVSAIRRPYQRQHPNIVKGWLCVTSDCGYCSSTKESRCQHQRRQHNGEQLSTVQVLALRLNYTKAQTSGYFIARLDAITTNSVEPNNSASQDNSGYNNQEDDGDELVPSDMGNEEDLR